MMMATATRISLNNFNGNLYPLRLASVMAVNVTANGIEGAVWNPIYLTNLAINKSAPSGILNVSVTIDKNISCLADLCGDGSGAS